MNLQLLLDKAKLLAKENEVYKFIWYFSENGIARQDCVKIEVINESTKSRACVLVNDASQIENVFELIR